MMTLRHGRGDTKLGCMVWIVLAGALAMVLWKAVPVKLASAEFYNYMDEQAKFASRFGAAHMKKELLKRAAELQLPLDAKHLSVERRGGRVVIRATYTVPLEFPGYTYEWTFEQEINEPYFIF